MTKTLSALFIALFLFQMGALSANALEIVISDTGRVSFYHDQVLGDDDDRDEKEDEDEHEDNEREDKNEDRSKEDEHRPEKSREKETVREDRAFKTVNSSRTRLRVESDHQKSRVTIEQKNDRDREDGKFERQEMGSSDRLKIELPSQLRDHEQDDEDHQEDEREEEEHEDENENHFAPARNSEEIREERRERKEERIEIKSKLEDDGTTRFEFKSRSIEAKARGAEFIVDPETNEITVVTPSGETHVLTHLPDQAALQMEAAGLLDSDSIAAGEIELEMETKDDGSVVYSADIKKRKRFLGLFPREKVSRVELDDETGQITETPEEANSLFGQLLDAVTF